MCWGTSGLLMTERGGETLFFHSRGRDRAGRRYQLVLGLWRGDAGLIIGGVVGGFPRGLEPRVFEDLFEIGAVLCTELQQPLNQ